MNSIRALGKSMFLLVARIAKEDVDWPETMIWNLDFQFSETEIVPKIGTRLKMMDIRRLAGDPLKGETFHAAESLEGFPTHASVSH